jgi:hypothetical protein
MGTTSHHAAGMILPAAPVFADARANMATQIAFFTHTVQTKANSIRFAHQFLCSPTISTLLKAIWRKYLKGCPNLMSHGVTKYLNPSPATAKGHMKHPRQGVRSTRTPTIIQADASPRLHPSIVVNDTAHQQEPPMPLIPFALIPNVIEDDMDNQTDANLFCFATFADKHTRTLYNNLTGTFPFMSLKGNVCFLVVYHYESNAILALPISGFSDNIIFQAYKQIYEMIESKGSVIRFNIMDNQASKVIKKFLTPKQCDLMLVEPNNHCINATEYAIQTFKDHFVSALATKDSKFPLQLWDQLAPPVETTLNMLCPSCIDPSKLAYKALHGPYD